MTTTTLSLRDLGISPGHGKHVALDVELPPYVQAGIDYVPQPVPVPVTIDVSAMIEGTAFHMNATVDYHGPCARCLEEAVYTAYVDSYLVHDPREEDEELRSEHVDDETNELDVTGWLREEIGVKFPTKVLCRKDCPGLGTTWADPASEDELAPDGTPIDPRWAALKTLELGDEPDTDSGS